jgi:hypothetical protein
MTHPEEDGLELGSLESLPNRTLILKMANEIREAVAKDRPVTAYWLWKDIFTNHGQDYSDAVWSTLTTPQRDYLRSVQNERDGPYSGAVDYHGRKTAPGQ